MRGRGQKDEDVKREYKLVRAREKACERRHGNCSLTIVLNRRKYDPSRPIAMRTTASTIRGAAHLCGSLPVD